MDLQSLYNLAIAPAKLIYEILPDSNQKQTDMGHQHSKSSGHLKLGRGRMCEGGHPLVRLAGLSGAAAVTLGAYGSHALREREDVSQRRKYAFDTANRMHLIHSGVLLATPLCRRPYLTGTLLSAGMFLFCGSVYHYSLTGKEHLRRVAPFGGMMLIVAWLSMLV